MVTETRNPTIAADAAPTAEPVPSDAWLEDLLGPLSLDLEDEAEIRESMMLLPDIGAEPSELSDRAPNLIKMAWWSA
jgi:hypothetical protein